MNDEETVKVVRGSFFNIWVAALVFDLLLKKLEDALVF